MSLSPTAVGDLQVALQMGAVTRLHLPLVEKLLARRQSGSIAGLRDLAKLSEQEWLATLDEEQVGGNGQSVGYPADIEGESPGEKKANYAKALRRTMEAAFPTAAIAGDMRRAAPPAGDAVVDFLDANTSFEIGKTRLIDGVREAADLDPDLWSPEPMFDELIRRGWRFEDLNTG